MCILSYGVRDLTKREKTKRGENHGTRTSRRGSPATAARLNCFIYSFDLNCTHFKPHFMDSHIFVRFDIGDIFILGQCSFSSTVLLHAVPGSPADVAVHEDGVKVQTMFINHIFTPLHKCCMFWYKVTLYILYVFLCSVHTRCDSECSRAVALWCPALWL